MEIKNINKDNWSGEYVEIKIFKNKVSLYGVCGSEKWEDFKIKIHRNVKDFVHFSVWNDGWCYPVVSGYQEKDGSWVAQAEVQRYDKSLHVAIAKVLYNIL